MINLSSKQLLKAADIKDQIEALESELATVLGGSGNGIPSPFKAPKTKRGMSAAGRARIAAAQKARWAKVKGAKPVKAEKPAKKRKKISAEGIARIKAAQKLRWAKVKGVKGKTVAEKVTEAVVVAAKPSEVVKPGKIKRKMSAAAKAAISAAAKRRWAARKAAGKNTL